MSIIQKKIEFFMQSLQRKPVWLYIPWIKGHTQTLIGSLAVQRKVRFVPLNLAQAVLGSRTLDRGAVWNMALKSTAEFRSKLLAYIVRVRVPVHGLVVTADWSPGLRDAVVLCKDIGLPTVLVPHESVFADEEAYYRYDPIGSFIPACSRVLGWGGIHRDVFTRRGYPVENIEVLGSPKLDIYKSYTPRINARTLARKYGLDPVRKTVLFAAQPLDLQYGDSDVQGRQCAAIRDAIDATRRLGCQLVVRLPPARGWEILDDNTRMCISEASHTVLDGEKEGKCRATPSDAIFHATVVISINSTMLMEAALMNVPAIVLGYLNFDSMWYSKAGMPRVSNLDELENAMQSVLQNRRHTMSPHGEAWIKWAFSPGGFDGKASERIVDYLFENYKCSYNLPKLVSKIDIGK